MNPPQPLCTPSLVDRSKKNNSNENKKKINNGDKEIQKNLRIVQDDTKPDFSDETTNMKPEETILLAPEILPK